MSNETKTAAVQPAAPAKEKKPSVVDTFLKGCARGFKVGIENITPAMILGYVLVYILQETGLMDLLGVVMSPVMNLFGLPGEAFAVLISAFFAKASGCATAASMYQAGTLTLGFHDAARLYPDGHPDRPLRPHCAGHRLQQEVAPPAHRDLPAGRGHQLSNYARHPGDHGHSANSYNSNAVHVLYAGEKFAFLLMFCLQFYGIQLYQYQNSIGLLLQQQAKISTI